jgi:serine phosphatase RsbU (regulator of sigma subunit)
MVLLSELRIPDDSPSDLTVDRVRILVCEDEGLTVLRLRKVLSHLGYEVVSAARDGEEAVREAHRLRPDVILMDVRMPKLDGIQATERIMQNCPTAVIMLTAFSEPELVLRALAAGASGYLVKPVADDQLRPAITVACGRFAELQRERQVTSTLAESYASQLPRVPGLQIACRYQAASEAALEEGQGSVGSARRFTGSSPTAPRPPVGGDFFDFIPLGDDRVGILLGDVCGSGLATATYTAMARHVVHAFSLEDPTPARVVSRLNWALCSQMPEECPFLTLVYAVLDRQTLALTYVNAGHPSPVVYEPNAGMCRELAATGGVVGAAPEMAYTQASVTLQPGFVLALFTDGVTEARTGEEMLGSEGVAAVVEEHASKSANSIVEAILERARRFAGGELHDDVAIVVIRNE